MTCSGELNPGYVIMHRALYGTRGDADGPL